MSDYAGINDVLVRGSGPITDSQLEAAAKALAAKGRACKWKRHPDGRIVSVSWPLGQACPFSRDVLDYPNKPDDFNAKGTAL